MNNLSSSKQTVDNQYSEPTHASSANDRLAPESTLAATEPKPSYVKLAMRNMVRKRGTSLKHFVVTTIGLLAFLVGLAYLTR